MTYGAPKRGTVMKTARCRHCDEILYSGGSWGPGWWHDISGDQECEES